MFHTNALTYQDILSMDVVERMELEEALDIWMSEWKPPSPKCPLVR